MADQAMSIAKGLVRTTHRKAVFGRRVHVLARLLSEQLKDGEIVLDVGSGDGTVALAVMARQPGLTISGVDVLRRPGTRIPVAVYDGEKLPFADSSAYWVTIIDVLHHTDNPAASSQRLPVSREKES